ncbi:MAG: Arylsulfotransferase, partial [Pseudomonadota bacterium]
GDVQRLPGGNTLITYSNDHVLQEVTPDKQVVMEWIAPASFGYSTFLEYLYPARL